MKDHEINIVAKAFAADYETRAAIDHRMAQQKRHLVDYAAAHPYAFVGKRLQLDGGVCVQRSTRQQVRMDRSKITPDWLQRMLDHGNNPAIEIRIDPRKLRNDSSTALLLQEIAYELENKEILSVMLGGYA